MTINFCSYIVVRTQRNCLHDEVRTCWEGCLVILVISLLSPLRRSGIMAAWEKLANTINSALAQFSLATLVFSSKEDPKFAQSFCFHARASAICEYRDWFHLHVCVESHKVLRFVLQTIIWSLPMSNSWYHNFYYGAVHRYNNSMPILFSFLYS